MSATTRGVLRWSGCVSSHAVRSSDATTDGEGTIHRVIRAPTAPGEGRVVVTVDGRALRVRPRVLFARAR